MRITMTAKNFTITEPMRARIEKKLNKMDRYFREEAEAQVRLSQERNVRFIAEMTLMVGGVMFRAEEENDDMYAAIDRALDRLDRQVHRHRPTLGKRAVAEVLAEPEDAVPAWEEQPDELVRVKRFAVKPMAVEDAIAQMDMLGHSFFVFINAETGITSVIYRRADGKIGMIEPIQG